MKTIQSILLSIVLISFVSCSKHDIIRIEEHDKNVMMNEMHKMIRVMMTTPMPGDPDHHFAKMMMMHHQGAIHMADIVLKNGKDTTIRRMAHRMKEMQTMEVAELQSFLDHHLPHEMDPEFNMKMEMSMEKMDRNADLQIINGNLDHDFAILIIFHHQSAIEMADLVIHYGHEPMIKHMAEKMKQDQEMEIAELQKWLLKNR
ncbi:MAG: DUF305 domain-containing protein [Chitinophagaceae bacterium]